MGHDHDHHSMLARLRAELAPVFDHSPDGVYLWLDETTKACNGRLAAMFGYSVEEWEATSPFLQSFVADEDQATYAQHYQAAVGGLQRPVTFRFRAVRKDGSTFAAETDMVPLVAEGHPVAYHFVRDVSDA